MKASIFHAFLITWWHLKWDIKNQKINQYDSTRFSWGFSSSTCTFSGIFSSVRSALTFMTASWVSMYPCSSSRLLPPWYSSTWHKYRSVMTFRDTYNLYQHIHQYCINGKRIFFYKFQAIKFPYHSMKFWKCNYRDFINFCRSTYIHWVKISLFLNSKKICWDLISLYCNL